MLCIRHGMQPAKLCSAAMPKVSPSSCFGIPVKPTGYITVNGRSDLFAGLYHIISYESSVVTVAGICNSVGVGVFVVFSLTCHRSGGGGGEYRSVSRQGLLIGNTWMSRFGCPGMR